MTPRCIHRSDCAHESLSKKAVTPLNRPQGYVLPLLSLVIQCHQTQCGDYHSLRRRHHRRCGQQAPRGHRRSRERGGGAPSARSLSHPMKTDCVSWPWSPPTTTTAVLGRSPS
ncbi:unnamed protein product, partial [Laminaria digitata]